VPRSALNALLAITCQRTIGTIKSLIAKVAYQYPKSWHRYLDLILWAMRESVNETPNVAPYTAVFGQLPRGPLAVLRDVWLNEGDYPTSDTSMSQDGAGHPHATTPLDFLPLTVYYKNITIQKNKR